MKFKIVHSKEDAKGLFTKTIEEWKDIQGYEGHYQISNQGRVKSLARMRLSKGGSIAPLRERIMCLKKSKTGYLLIGLRKDDVKLFTSIHRLVALHFIENAEEKLTVNHIDGDKENNCYTNLEWSSHKENTVHAFETGLAKRRGNEKYSLEFKKSIQDYYIESSCSIVELAEKFNISNRSAGRFSKGILGTVHSAVLRNHSEEISLLRKQGWTLSRIAEKFNIGISHVHRIVNGHVSEANHER